MERLDVATRHLCCLLDPRRVVKSLAFLVIGALVSNVPAVAEQTWHEKKLYFGDMHWHSCLSQDASRAATLTSQYESMLQDYQLDFSMESDHAEAATAGIKQCGPYMPLTLVSQNPPIYYTYSGEQIATEMKRAADEWNGRVLENSHGTIQFVTFPGYEWAPDARCWQASPLNPFPNDLNSDDNTPGHINYFFSTTTGWTYHDDVWEPGDGDSDTCATATALGLTYYSGSKDWTDEILGQLIHQRDDPNRYYDLMIQYNHPAASIDKGGSSDHLAKWYDFEHSSSYCNVASGGPACGENQCEALRRAYGVTSVEWYTNQEAAIGSTERHGDEGLACTGNALIDALSPRCYHDTHHIADRYLSSRGLREGYALSFAGGSDSHRGRRFDPDGDFPGNRGAGSRSLTVVYAEEPTRAAIWDGLNKRRTYALSRLREIGPVHKGRVDFYTTEPIGNEGDGAASVAGEIGGIQAREYGMGDLVETVAGGVGRSFTISAAAEEGTIGVYPVELRLYRVGPSTPLTQKTDASYYWLDDIPEDPGKFGQLVGIFRNATGAPTLSHTFTGIVVGPGDALFAVVPFSDYAWIDDFYDMNRAPLDEDHDGVTDPGKSGFSHGDNNTWARTTPIFFYEANERATQTPACASVTFGSTGAESELASGGGDASYPGDASILPVAMPNLYPAEWNRGRFSVPADYYYVDLSFFTQRDEDNIGHLFAIRIDGQLVYSGRAGIDHQVDTLVELKDIYFPIKQGLHQVEVHMDDQEYANGDNDPNYHCNDYDGPPGFVDAIAFHNERGSNCSNQPPVADAGGDQTVECERDLHATAQLNGSASTDPDSSPETNDDIVGFVWSENGAQLATGVQASALFALGAHDVTLTVTDHAGATDTDNTLITVRDTLAPTGSITSPSRGACFGPRALPVTIADNFTDRCDPGITRRYTPPPGPSYSTHGDHLVQLDVADSSGNASVATVGFTIDTVPPNAQIVTPTDGQYLVTSTLPMSLFLRSSDQDGASGGVVHEVLRLQGCTIFDGATYGNKDGLLSDEQLQLSQAELCRIAGECGFDQLTNAVIQLEATDCGGNVGTGSRNLRGSIKLKGGICPAGP